VKFRFTRSGLPAIIGIDISASAIKMVELSKTDKGQLQLDRYTVEALPRDAVVDGNVSNLEAVIATMRRARLHLGSKAQRAALALPAAAVITKKIIAPAGLDETDLELQVEAEANQYIPFPLEEVNLDFQELGAVAGSPGEVEVLIAAARKEKVEDRVAAAEGGDFIAEVMDVESYAMLAATQLLLPTLPRSDDSQTVAIVDIGATKTHLHVLHDGQSVYVREQSFGGDLLTQEIQGRYGLSAEEAEIGKRHGTLPENYPDEILRPFIETLVLEITRALQFFFSSTHFSRIDCLLLAGGCSQIPGLAEATTEQAQVAVQIANPFAGMALGPAVKTRQLNADAPSLLVACGLAMRRFEP
jgi:type IV pilus assembly protein PilM